MSVDSRARGRGSPNRRARRSPASNSARKAKGKQSARSTEKSRPAPESHPPKARPEKSVVSRAPFGPLRISHAREWRLASEWLDEPEAIIERRLRLLHAAAELAEDPYLYPAKQAVLERLAILVRNRKVPTDMRRLAKGFHHLLFPRYALPRLPGRNRMALTTDQCQTVFENTRERFKKLCGGARRKWCSSLRKDILSEFGSQIEGALSILDHLHDYRLTPSFIIRTIAAARLGASESLIQKRLSRSSR